MASLSNLGTKARLEDISVRVKLSVLIGVFTVGFLASGMIAWGTIQRVKVKGPIYNELVQSFDVIADVLPPPEYLVESNMVVMQILGETDPAERSQAVSRLNALRKDFDSRYEYWKKELREGDLKAALVVGSHGPAVDFWNTVENQFIPAVQAGEMNRARDLAYGEIARAYATHRSEIDRVVKLANEHRDATEVNAKAEIQKRTRALVALWFSVLAIAMLLGALIAAGIVGPLRQGISFMKDLSLGHLGTRLRMTRKDEIGDLARTMDEFADDLQQKVVATMQEIAAGDLTSEVRAKDGQDEISPALKQMIDSLRNMTAEVENLRRAALEGRLAIRADSTRYQGDYQKIVQGVNDTLDAVIGPLNVAATYVDRISKGDIPARITDSYHGDFNEIKNNLNTCIDAVSALIADASMLSKAGVAGNLATRADASKHQGDYRKILRGVNESLDAVIGPLNVAATYVDRICKGDIPEKITDNYNGDFNTLKSNLNTCIDAVNATGRGLAAARGRRRSRGSLATRADATKHHGDFRKIVQGVNDTLDAVITPINEAAAVLERVANRDLTARVTGDYRGDLATDQELAEPRR